MWDDGIVKSVVRAAKEGLKAQKWARDFYDKLKRHNITAATIEIAVAKADAIVLYRHLGLRSVGFWHEGQKFVAVWSLRRLSNWVTNFRRPEGLRYLLAAEDAEVLLAEKKKFKRCEPEEADVILSTCEDLGKALQQYPKGLTKNE